MTAMTEEAYKRLEPLLTKRELLEDALFDGLCAMAEGENPLQSEEENICRDILENEILEEVKKTNPRAASDIMVLLDVYMLNAVKRQAFRVGMDAAIRALNPKHDSIPCIGGLGMDR